MIIHDGEFSIELSDSDGSGGVQVEIVNPDGEASFNLSPNEVSRVIGFLLAIEHMAS